MTLHQKPYVSPNRRVDFTTEKLARRNMVMGGAVQKIIGMDVQQPVITNAAPIGRMENVIISDSGYCIE